MNAQPVLSQPFSSFVIAGVFLVLPLAGLAADAPSPRTLDITVLSNGYVAAGKPFADVAALEDWVRPFAVREIRLDGCGPASGKRVLAAVERFQSAYSEPIRIRRLSSGDAACASAFNIAGMGHVGGMRSVADHDGYLATDEAGRSTLP